jgi:hypothetical protein
MNILLAQNYNSSTVIVSQGPPISSYHVYRIQALFDLAPPQEIYHRIFDSAVACRNSDETAGTTW